MNFLDASLALFGITKNFLDRVVHVLSTNRRIGRFVILGLAPLPGMLTALFLPESLALQMTFLQVVADMLSSIVPAIGRYSDASVWPKMTKIAILAFLLALPLQTFVLTLIEYDLWRKRQVIRHVSTFKFLVMCTLWLAGTFWIAILGPSPDKIATLSFSSAMIESRAAPAFYGALFWSWSVAMAVGGIVHICFLVAPESVEERGEHGQN